MYITYKILDNPFYYGVMRMLKTGKKYPHIYPPIISKELFDACQQVRLDLKKKPFKYREKEYIFRGLIECAATGRVVTADTKYKTYSNSTTSCWTYLRAWHPDNLNKKVFVKEEAIIKEVEQVFRSMQLEPKMLEKVIEYIKSSAKAEQECYQLRIRELHTEHTKIKTRMDKLTDIFLDGDISKEVHEEKREQLITRREEIMQEIEINNRADNNFSKCLIRLVQIASGAFETFKSSTTTEKRKLVNFVFANLKLNGHELDFTLRPLFDTFTKLPKNEKWWR